jgi:hypothetical protein
MVVPVARHQSPVARAAAAAVLAVAIVVGSGFLWLGIPWGGLWLAGALTTNSEAFLFAALGGVPLAMVGFGWLLYRLNNLYEGMRGGPRRAVMNRSAWLVSSSEERAKFRRARAPRGLIDIAMTASAIAALVLLFVWFFFLAGSPLAPTG